MPKHKRQHFLAQQQIRRWSKTEASVRAFDGSAQEIIPRVSIKKTGQEDHFYEREPVGVEAALSSLEAKMKKVTDRIHHLQELPTLDDEDRFALMMYATTQLVRKEQTAGPARELLTEVVQRTAKWLEGTGELPPRPAALEGIELKAKVEDQWPRQMAVKTGMESWALLADLEVMLLKSIRRRVLLPDAGAMLDNRIAAATGCPFGTGSMGTCVMLPLGPEYCVVWYDWNVFRRTSPGKIHEMTEEEELEFGARSILCSERLTYFEEDETANKWCLDCVRHARKEPQTGRGWRPIPGLETPMAHKWRGFQPPSMGIPARPHIRRALEMVRCNQVKGKEPSDEVCSAILIELETEWPGIVETLNEGR